MAKEKVRTHGIASPKENMAGYRFGKMPNNCYIYLNSRQKWRFYRSGDNVRLEHHGKCVFITIPVDKFSRSWTIIEEKKDEFI